MRWSVEIRDAIATITYDNGPENRLPFRALVELDEALAEIAANDKVALVVVRSAIEDTFAVGADLADLCAVSFGTPPSAPFDSWISALFRLEDMPQPTVAFVDGMAASGGFELSLACTFRVGTAKARFELREVPNGGIPAAGGAQRLPRVVGQARAAEIIMTGRTVHADEALRLGILQELLPDGGTALDDWLARFTRMRRDALVAAKRAIVNSARLPIGDAMRIEQDMFRALVGSPSMQEHFRTISGQDRN